MTDIRNLATLMIVGLVPCALAGGFSQYGDSHILPWALGFGAQAVYVASAIAWRRWKPAH